ncbi:MAG: Ger(x)C family spore germination protein [Desulfitobacteriaceae bacterium]
MRKSAYLFVILVLLTQITGCWGSIELENLAIVTIAGIDKVTVDGKDQFIYSARVMRPLGLKGSQGGNSDPSQGGGIQDVFLTGEGDTIQAAARQSTLRTPRHPYFGHMKVLLIGERVAKEGLGQLMELYARSPEVRLRTYFMVAKGKAADVLQAKPEIDATIAQELGKLAEDKVVTIGISHGVTLGEFFQKLLAQDRTAVASAVTVEQQNGDRRASLEGLAVFKEDKLVGWLTKEETTGYLLVNNYLKNSQTPIPVRESESVFYTYLLKKGQCTITPRVDGDKLSFDVKVKTEGALQEISGISVTKETVEQLELRIAEVIKSIVEKSFAKAQALDSDYIGLAYNLHRKDPALWGDLRPDWNSVLKDVKVNVEVESKVTQFGQTGKSLSFGL